MYTMAMSESPSTMSGQLQKEFVGWLRAYLFGSHRTDLHVAFMDFHSDHVTLEVTDDGAGSHYRLDQPPHLLWSRFLSGSRVDSDEITWVGESQSTHLAR